MVSTYVPIENFVDACGRINPNDQALPSTVKTLMDQGPSFTLAVAIVKIADDQASVRRPVASEPSAI
jgi:hypothetical protein